MSFLLILAFIASCQTYFPCNAERYFCCTCTPEEPEVPEKPEVPQPPEEVDDGFIRSPRISEAGDWGHLAMCQPGYNIRGMQLRYQEPHSGDNIGLTSIAFFCHENGEHGSLLRRIRSLEVDIGDIGYLEICQNFEKVIGFEMRSDHQASSPDNTGANRLKIFCSGNGEVLEDGASNLRGQWTGVQKCKGNKATCGFRTQVLPDQFSGDDEAVVNLDMLCCDGKGRGVNKRDTGKTKLICDCKEVQNNPEPSEEIKSGESLENTTPGNQENTTRDSEENKTSESEETGELLCGGLKFEELSSIDEDVLVRGGVHNTAAPFQTYVCRAQVRVKPPHIVLGYMHKIPPGSSNGRWTCFIWNGKQILGHKNFQSLTNRPRVSENWVKADRVVPDNAVPGGKLGDLPLYMTRCHVEVQGSDYLVLGYTHDGSAMHYVLNGKAAVCNEFEVLLCPTSL